MKRLKGAIDSRIAEEQARAKAASAVPTRASSTARRSTSDRNESPAKRARAKPKEADDGARGPDPSVFEGAFVIEDDSEEPSRVGTPAIGDTKAETMDEGRTTEEAGEGRGQETTSEKTEALLQPLEATELPPDVRAKLRKLEKLESRYQGMLG
jgi:hypothetical protein